MVATGPANFLTSLAVSAPLVQPSMSPAAVKTGASGAAGGVAAAGPTAAPPNPARETDATSTAAQAAARRRDVVPTRNTPPDVTRPFLPDHSGFDLSSEIS